MKELFAGIPAIKYEGTGSKNPLAFKFYNADEIVMGKPMKDHLPFAMAWWHNLGANGPTCLAAAPPINRSAKFRARWRTQWPKSMPDLNLCRSWAYGTFVGTT